MQSHVFHTSRANDSVITKVFQKTPVPCDDDDGDVWWVTLGIPTTARTRALRAYMVAVVTKKRMIRMGLRVVYFTTTMRNGHIVHEFDGNRIISSSELLQNCIVRLACRRRVVELRHMV
jgi:hypothetical protein